MFGKSFARSKKQNGNGNGSKFSGGHISKLLSASGRISLPALQKLCHMYSKEDFVKFMQEPALLGSAIQTGTLSTQSNFGNNEMNRTVLFEPEESEDPLSDSDTLKHAIYPLIKSEFSASTGNFFSIGRIEGNDLIMPDYAISKQHATIQIKRGSYLLKDYGSTNGTLVNGQHLEKKHTLLQNEDIISFARYEFAFLFPGSIYDMLA